MASRIIKSTLTQLFVFKPIRTTLKATLKIRDTDPWKRPAVASRHKGPVMREAFPRYGDGMAHQIMIVPGNDTAQKWR